MLTTNLHRLDVTYSWLFPQTEVFQKRRMFHLIIDVQLQFVHCFCRWSHRIKGFEELFQLMNQELDCVRSISCANDIDSRKLSVLELLSTVKRNFISACCLTLEKYANNEVALTHRIVFTRFSLFALSISDLAPTKKFLVLSSSPSIKNNFFVMPQC